MAPIYQKPRKKSKRILFQRHFISPPALGLARDTEDAEGGHTSRESGRADSLETPAAFSRNKFTLRPLWLRGEPGFSFLRLSGLFVEKLILEEDLSQQVSYIIKKGFMGLWVRGRKERQVVRPEDLKE